MSEMQRQVDEWVSQYKIGYFEPLAILGRLTEENGELAREINHRFGPKKKKKTEKEGSISEEMGDILFTVACLANVLEIDLDESFKIAMDKAYGRDAERYERK